MVTTTEWQAAGRGSRRAAQVVAASRGALLELRKRPATWVVGAVVLYDTLFTWYLSGYATYLQAQAGLVRLTLPFPTYLRRLLPEEVERVVVARLAGGEMFASGPPLALILGAVAAGGDWDWGTLASVLTQRPSRGAVYAGRVMALATVLVALVLATFAGAAGASAVIAAREGAASIWPPASAIARGLGAASLVLAMWGALGMVLGTILRGVAPAIGAGLVWLFVGETAVATLAPAAPTLAALQSGLPGANATALAASFGLPGFPASRLDGTIPGSPAQFVVVLATYVAASLIIGVVVLQRRDIT